MSPAQLPGLGVALVLLFAAESAATTIRVPTDRPTIASALSAVVSGDTVLVACGTYTEPGLNLPPGVALLGNSADSTCTVIQNSITGTSILAIVNGNASTVVRWLTFRGGRGVNGGAIQAWGHPVIANCRFEDNQATSDGGAIFAGNQPRLVQCEFVDNRATSDGGAVFCSNAAPIDSCTFRRNRAAQGGGLSVDNGEVRACLFEANRAATSGGGVYVLDAGDVDVHHSWFRADSSGGSGGGASLTGVKGFRSCVFERNRATLDGGGMWVFTAVTTEDCLFVGNSAGRAGGGYAKDRSSNHESTVRWCTFYGNRALTGGGVAATRKGSPRLEHCVIQGSVAGGGFSWATSTLPPYLECSDIYGNTGGDWTGPIAGLLGVNGNFSGDALFCDAPGGLLTVSSASPLLATNNECGVPIGSESQGCESDGVVVTTYPPGLALEVDGMPAVGPTVFDWSSGSSHTIGTASLYAPMTGVRNEFQSWSDGGELTHSVIAPPSPAGFTASFGKTYFVTMESDTGGGASPVTGWFAAQQPLTIAELPDKDYLPVGWTGTGLGSYTGSSPIRELPLRAPITERARFQYNGNYPLTMIAEGGGTVLPASASLHVGTPVTIRASRPPGYIFTGWTGQGAGSYTGPDSVKSITMLGPIVQTGTFQYVGYVPLTMQTVGSGTVTPESGDFPAQWPVLITASPAPGYTFYRWVGQGSGSYTGTDWSWFVVTNEALMQTACFAEGGNFPLTVSATAGGTVFPLSGNRPAGASVAIGALAQSGWRFREWEGTGFGSYSGPISNITLTMHGPITQHAVFEPDDKGHGYEFSISASATDPMVNVAVPTGDYRSLYLWLVCGQGGLAALEAGVSSTLPLVGFTAEEGVYDVEPGPDLALAVGGCPGDVGMPRLLGSWLVQDLGGEICLGPSEMNGSIGAVDCGTQPSFWTDPRVYGFSSSGVPPCIVGANSCDSIGPVSLVLSQLEASVGARAVSVAWVTSAAINHAGFHVYRSELGYDVYRRLTSELLVGESPHHYVDASVEGDRVYYYKVGAVEVGGLEVLYGPVSVTTPRWAPLVTSLSGVQPNPFRGSTQVRFSLAAPSRARLTLYDIAGRLVATIQDRELPAGEHAVEWNGRSASGRMASGIYFLRFEAGDRKETERIVLLGTTR